MWKDFELVFAYTDDDALRDGVLVATGGLTPIPINRVTRAVWDTFVRPIGRSPLTGVVTDVTGLSRLGDEVGRCIKMGELQEGWVVMEWEGHKIWAMPNDTRFSHIRPDVEGWTIMFPEDY